MILTLFMTLGLLLFGVWAAGALWFRAPWLTPVIPGLLAVLAASAWLLWRPPGGGLVGWPGGMLLALLCVVPMMMWWRTIVPSADRIWALPLSRLPAVTVVGDTYTITNVRRFDWVAKPGTMQEQVAEARWETRTYDLTKAAGADLFFSYWTGPLIAHLLVSVTFDDAPPLAFSIEIRREDGESYSTLAGFFKTYELAIIAADETDVVKLRTDVWREDVRLYRLGISRDSARRLLMAYARDINGLNRAPRWYHTALANCTTVAYRIAREIWPALKPDWRVLVAGRAPELAYDIGALDRSLPFEEVKRLAAISEKARALPASADFSAGIRAGVPRPTAPLPSVP
jgi:hypothetical protein